MSRRIIQQPNGLYCQWSTITDSIVSYNASIEDIIEERLEEAKERITREIERELNTVNQFTMTWEDLPVITRKLIVENKLT